MAERKQQHREKGRERDRHRERETETGRQTDRQTEATETHIAWQIEGGKQTNKPSVVSLVSMVLNVHRNHKAY